ncbi:hypothetical protein XELAEV_18011053mg [Xenopus laevis]|uniref:Signal peptidase complex catalytic subunit SEC11 n=1 Tax=Xenopus laevis TaxID=8355 RepID=A0A974DVQ4_XENLA|nr:hypothetical protein XELAEV_18011053mg [Xenopus laevis]
MPSANMDLFGDLRRMNKRQFGNHLSWNFRNRRPLEVKDKVYLAQALWILNSQRVRTLNKEITLVKRELPVGDHKVIAKQHIKTKNCSYRQTGGSALKARLYYQVLNFAMIVSSALMIWKGLIVVTGSESPIVVVLSGSMEPAFHRGDLLFLTNFQEDPIRAGEIVVFKVEGRDIPIVHRVIKVHEKENGDIKFLTKGDNNEVDDRGLYKEGQSWLEKKDVVGRARGYLKGPSELQQPTCNCVSCDANVQGPCYDFACVPGEALSGVWGQFWTPVLKRDINELERVQRLSATKLDHFRHLLLTFPYTVPLLIQFKQQKCIYQYTVLLQLCSEILTHFILFHSRFLPYVGMVTIVMNDYPKFKGRCSYQQKSASVQWFFQRAPWSDRLLASSFIARYAVLAIMGAFVLLKRES